MAESDKLQDVLICTICLDIYQDPYILKCMHTICKTCLDQLCKRDYEAKCPECRQTTVKSEVKKDFNKQKLLDIYHSSSKNKDDCKPADCKDKVLDENCCEICNAAVITWGCMDCVKLLCDGCQVTHRAIPACTTHNLQPIDEVSKPFKTELHYTHACLDLIDKNLVDKRQSMEQNQKAIRSNYEDAQYKLKVVEDAIIADTRKYFDIIRRDLESQFREVHTRAVQQITGIDEQKKKFKEQNDEITSVLAKNSIKKIVYHSKGVCNKVGAEIKAAHIDMASYRCLTMKDPVVKYIKPPAFNSIVSHNIQRKEIQVVNDLPKEQPKAVSTVVNDIVTTNRPRSIRLHPVRRTKPRANTPSKTQQLNAKENQETPDNIKQDINFEVYLNSKPELSKSVHLNSPTEEYFKLSLVDSELWCMMSDKIEVYDLDGMYMRTFRSDHMGNPYALLKLEGVKIILVASNKGLLHFNENEEFVDSISPDQYVDISNIVGTKNAICGIDMWKQRAVAFTYEILGGWSQTGEIALEQEISDFRDTVVASTEYIYICSYVKSCVYKHKTIGGAVIAKYTKSDTLLAEPRLCCMVHNGSVLLTDKTNPSLIIWNVDSGNEINKPQTNEIKCEVENDLSPIYSVVDCKGAIWVLSKGVLSELYKFVLPQGNDEVYLGELTADEQTKLLERLSDI